MGARKNVCGRGLLGVTPENPYNICGFLTWLQVPYCNFEVHL